MCLDLCGLNYLFRTNLQLEGSQNASPHSLVTTGYDVFLIHSGLQKDFVEQLYVDLKRAGINVFFDKKSLVKGEEFPEHLRKVASTCKIAVAVLSEDFFTASSWPMAEIITSVEAKTPIIYPLFYLISSKRVKDVKKQEEWSAKWESWGMERHNMGLEQWKATLKKIGRTFGEEKNEFMSEVEYREKVAVCINEMLENNNEKIVSRSVVTRGETSRSGSTSGAVVSGIATQPSNVVASSGSAGSQFGERFGVGLPIGLGVGVGQGVGLALAEAVLHLLSPAEENPPSQSTGESLYSSPSSSGWGGGGSSHTSTKAGKVTRCIFCGSPMKGLICMRCPARGLVSLQPQGPDQDS